MLHYRLLVIEDNTNIAEMIRRAASEAGYDACMAIGLNAMAIYDEFMPHVIVMDVLMPEMDGFEFLQFLQLRKSTARIVIISGSSDLYRKIVEDVGLSNGLHIEANIPKPFRVSEVRTMLRKLQKHIKDGASKKDVVNG